ncbi:MAG: DHH family phosphoesterase [Candidatus Aenigmatarchaeota archaeon]
MFLEEIERSAKIFKSIISQKKVKIISHIDADGITSASILSKMLLRMNKNFELKFVKQLTRSKIDRIKFTENDIFILSDLGSGQLNFLKDIFEKTQVFILDHHEPVEYKHLNLFHLNPILFNEEEISSSMICYLFAKNVSIQNTDLIDLAIVGAIGDEQDEGWRLKGLAGKILEEAEILGKVVVTKGIRLYGRNTRPIHKSLEHSFDPFIPGITGSESQAVQFLSELGISVKENGEWKKLKDLTIEEQQKLASAIILERLKFSQPNAVDIFGEIYTLLEMEEELQDAREFATLLNACGRTNKLDFGLRLCLNGNKNEEIWSIMEEYKKQISESLRLLREGNIALSTRNANFILAENKIPDTLIGTITSIALNSNIFQNKKPIFGLAETEENCLKVSARASKELKNINLKEILDYVTKKIGGEAGGHAHAAGALIDKSLQNDFVNIIDSKLGEIFGKEKG